MKKYLSLILMICLIISSMPAVNVFAQPAADNIYIQSHSQSMTFSKMQMGKVNCSISNSGAPIGARVETYIDGYLQTDAPSPYFVIYSHNEENFDVYIPPMIDASVSHTLTLKFIFDDYSYKLLTVPFTVNTTLPEINAEIVSHPISVKPGMEIYYAVKMNFSDNRYGYRIRTSIDLNGTHVPALDKVYTVGDEEVILVTIPSEYTNVTDTTFKFEFNVNSFAGYGETSAYVGKLLPTEGNEAAFEAANSGANDNSLIKPVKIPALVKRDARAYKSFSLTGSYIVLPQGSYVTYKNPDNHNSMSRAKIQTDDGSIYWTAMSNIEISTANYVIPDTLTIQQKEAFVNDGGYSSKTGYLIWVNLERQILTLFMGSKGNWGYVKSFPVATGKNYTPTPTVVHEITGKTRWVTATYTCNPVMLLYDGYAIHNQPESHSGYVTDPTIGKPASAGCVRMLKADINLLNYYCPIGTNVVIY